MTFKRSLQCLFFALLCCLFLGGRLVAQNPVVDTKQTNPSQTISSEDIENLPGPRKVLDLIKVMPATSPGYSSTVKQGLGMNIINLTTPANEVMELYLPIEIVEGHSFAGTIMTKSGPRSETKMNPFVALWEEERFKWQPTGLESFDAKLAPDGPNDWLLSIMTGAAGAHWTFRVPVQPKDSAPPVISDFPTSGTAGNPLLIRCPSTGLLIPNTYFRMGGTPMPILTSTVGSVVVQNNYAVPGITEIETNVGKGVEKYKFRNITLRLSADKTNLLKGETTPLRIEVAGLENLRAPATMTIDATGVISLDGGNSQRFAIDPAAISANGIYRLGKTLTGISAGGFGVKVTVVVGKEVF
jgi:hypothetical protein